MNIHEEKEMIGKIINEMPRVKAPAAEEEYRSFVIKVTVWARNSDEAYKLLDAGKFEDPEIEDVFEGQNKE